jgi:hypothetical protein
MNKDYFISAFGTFGNPNGFKQTFWFTNNRDVVSKIKTFDLNTNAIKLFPKSKLYSIRKEYANGFNTIAYSIYTFAKEQNSDRSGTFIGSSILYTNKIAKEHITIAQLNEFHNQLITKNVANDTISVNHSDKFSVVKPKDFDKIEFHLREIENLNFRQNTDNFLVVFCNIDENNLNQFFSKSIDLLNVYETIYFTDSQEVAEFVHQKGIFKLIQNVGEKREFEKEINALVEERKREREHSITEFKTEVQTILDYKNRTIEEFESQIDQNERIHHENGRILKESKEEVNKIAQFYDDFLSKATILINQLKNNDSKLEEVKRIHNNNKSLFNKGIGDLKRPNYIISAISKPKPKGNLHIEPQHQEFEHRSGHRRREEGGDKIYKTKTYKVPALILAFLLLGSWIYFLFFVPNSETKTEVIRNQEQINSIPQEPSTTPAVNTKLEDLSPIPNYKLN